MLSKGWEPTRQPPSHLLFCQEQRQTQLESESECLDAKMVGPKVSPISRVVKIFATVWSRPPMLHNKGPLPLGAGEICLGRQPDMLGVGVTEKAVGFFGCLKKSPFWRFAFCPLFQSPPLAATK